MMECWLIPPRLHLTEGRIGPLNAQPVHSRIADNPLRRARVVKPDVVANHGDARYSNPQGGSQDERWGARRALHAWVPSCHIVCRFSSKPSRRIPTTASQTVWQAQDPCGCGDVGRIRGRGWQQDKCCGRRPGVAAPSGRAGHGVLEPSSSVMFVQEYCLGSLVEVAVAEAVAIRHRFEDACFQLE